MVGYKESLCSPHEKLGPLSKELFKLFIFKEKANSASNSPNSIVNNLNFDNDSAGHLSINYEPDKSTTTIHKSPSYWIDKARLLLVKYGTR